jgi:hypothetical protein
VESISKKINKNNTKKDMNTKGELLRGEPKGGGKERREGDVEINMIKVHCMHIRKYYNETYLNCF